MIRKLTKAATRFVSVLLVFFLAIGGFTLAKNHGWLSPFGINSATNDSQVIQAVQRTQEVSLLKLSVQGIRDQADSASVFGTSIPGTEETVFLQYNFEAKLGFKGDEVEITKTGEGAYRISVPEFTFIGYDQPTFKVAATDGGVLSWATTDVDEIEMVNEILNDDAQETYIAENQDLLQDQTKVFYDSLITSIDPEIVTTYEFA